MDVSDVFKRGGWGERALQKQAGAKEHRLSWLIKVLS